MQTGLLWKGLTSAALEAPSTLQDQVDGPVKKIQDEVSQAVLIRSCQLGWSEWQAGHGWNLPRKKRHEDNTHRRV